ncbi:LytR/AlgR family response regulator transcription factor [Spiribacter vilamensis]|uniref:Two-component system response regulator AlgR n=1 Tax=Spiribacter vilamensis TaxID=531306 RepID=A0A4Q8D2B3_9GAMM|nr:LytTR family DNA-binding domain-containing protein [Spiribacter vilamensis]RZU99493.1 two-component system response regulator AlgR [Spiribacter vilamensis]
MMKIVIACEQPALRQRLAALAATSAGCCVAAVLETPAEAPASHGRDPVDVVVLGVRDEAHLAVAVDLANMTPAPAILLAGELADPIIPRLEESGVDYVVDTAQPTRFATALQAARPLGVSQIARLQAPGAGDERRHILCRRRNGLSLIPVDDVRCFVADHKYVTVQHDAGEDLIEESLCRLEAEFGPRFLRVHRSALVARDALRGLEKDLDGQTRALVDGSDDPLPVSRRRLPTVRRWMRTAATPG